GPLFAVVAAVAKEDDVMRPGASRPHPRREDLFARLASREINQHRLAKEGGDRELAHVHAGPAVAWTYEVGRRFDVRRDVRLHCDLGHQLAGWKRERLEFISAFPEPDRTAGPARRDLLGQVDHA